MSGMSRLSDAVVAISVESHADSDGRTKRCCYTLLCGFTCTLVVCGNWRCRERAFVQSLLSRVCTHCLGYVTRPLLPLKPSSADVLDCLSVHISSVSYCEGERQAKSRVKRRLTKIIVDVESLCLVTVKLSAQLKLKRNWKTLFQNSFETVFFPVLFRFHFNCAGSLTQIHRQAHATASGKVFFTACDR